MCQLRRTKPEVLVAVGAQLHGNDGGLWGWFGSEGPSGRANVGAGGAGDGETLAQYPTRWTSHSVIATLPCGPCPVERMMRMPSLSQFGALLWYESSLRLLRMS